MNLLFPSKISNFPRTRFRFGLDHTLSVYQVEHLRFCLQVPLILSKRKLLDSLGFPDIVRHRIHTIISLFYPGRTSSLSQPCFLGFHHPLICPGYFFPCGTGFGYTCLAIFPSRRQQHKQKTSHGLTSNLDVCDRFPTKDTKRANVQYHRGSIHSQPTPRPIH